MKLIPHDWGDADELTLSQIVSLLDQTQGPRASLGGSVGLGSQKITLSPEMVDQINAEPEEEAELAEPEIDDATRES